MQVAMWQTMIWNIVNINIPLWMTLVGIVFAVMVIPASKRKR